MTWRGSGLGIHALELVRALGGTTVAATSTAANADRLVSVADEVVVIDADGRFDDQVRRRNLRPDVVLDMSASFTIGESLRTVQAGGTVVIVGTLSARPVAVMSGAFIMREVRLLGSKATTVEELEVVLGLLACGRIRAHVTQQFPLEQ